MLFDSEVNFGNLVKLTNSGVFIASYNEIVEMLTTRYKEIYGNDINLSSTTADGIFIHNIALLINNILQGVQILSSNLDVDTASGVYLDNLCKLSNIFRKSATNSYVPVKIKNEGANLVELPQVSCVDVSGTIWTSKEGISLDSQDEISLNLYCEQTGEIPCSMGDLLQVVGINSNVFLSITQLDSATLGSNSESDADLRSRRNQSNSPLGLTVLQSLVGSLLEQPGVKDCLIYNNIEQTPSKTVDETVVPYHNIYITLRTDGTENETDIANKIFNGLTPGVLTTESTSSTGTPKSSHLYPSIFGVDDDLYRETIYWKLAKRQCPKIAISLTSQRFLNESILDSVGQQLISWLNELPLNSTITIDDIKMKLSEFDPLINGQRTYIIDSVVINNNANITSYTNTYSYFNYLNPAVSHYGASTSTITINQESDPKPEESNNE